MLPHLSQWQAVRLNGLLYWMYAVVQASQTGAGQTHGAAECSCTRTAGDESICKLLLCICAASIGPHILDKKFVCRVECSILSGNQSSQVPTNKSLNLDLWI